MTRLLKTSGNQPKKIGRPKGSKKGTKRIPSRDRMIVEGWSSEEMARAEHKTSQAMIGYINLSGQYEFWKANKKRIKEQARKEAQEEEYKKKILADITYSLISYKTLSHYKDKDAAQKALDYKSAYPKSTLPVRTLYTLFSKYNKAQKNGRKISLKTLSEEIEEDPTTTRRILKTVKLGAM